jgi:hypothetical protein
MSKWLIIAILPYGSIVTQIYTIWTHNIKAPTWLSILNFFLLLVQLSAFGIFLLTQSAWYKKKGTTRYEGKWVECEQPEWAKGIVGWTL